MQKKGNAGQMRLQRESRMQKKDMDAQVKKTGKINDGFICLPDPEDIYKWWYVIFGLDMDPYRGGYYMGYITCPDDYPAKAPKINLIIDNGRFRTDKKQDGICLSISHYHPESWNPAWKVNQIVIGLQTFW
jgi:ubiquitin-conjugating enzyme E2 J2